MATSRHEYNKELVRSFLERFYQEGDARRTKITSSDLGGFYMTFFIQTPQAFVANMVTSCQYYEQVIELDVIFKTYKKE